MSKTTLTQTLAVALWIALGGAAAAQETAPTTEAPATEAPAPEASAADTPVGDAATSDGLSMGATPAPAADGPGTMYVSATHGDWQQRCIRAQGDTPENCQLYQLLRDAQGNSVAEISLFALPDGQQAAAGATIIAPLETLLTDHLTLQIDTSPAKVYPFTWCSQIGCVARVGFTGPEIDGFKKGNKATITIVPVVAPDEKVALSVSLKGFTAGYDAVKAANTQAN